MAFWQRRIGVWNIILRAYWKGIVGVTLEYSWDREYGGDVALCLGLGVCWVEVQVLTTGRLWGRGKA